MELGKRKEMLEQILYSLQNNGCLKAGIIDGQIPLMAFNDVLKTIYVCIEESLSAQILEKNRDQTTVNKELDEVLQIALPDDYYKHIRNLLIPHLLKWRNA